jgi:hypothetical protein
MLNFKLMMILSSCVILSSCSSPYQSDVSTDAPSQDSLEEAPSQTKSRYNKP